MKIDRYKLIDKLNKGVMNKRKLDELERVRGTIREREGYEEEGIRREKKQGYEEEERERKTRRKREKLGPFDRLIVGNALR